MGCATAWALAERGADVTLVEQFELGHARGSSHGRTRIFRLAYPEAHWVTLAEEALAGWRELERQAGRDVLALHGVVDEKGAGCVLPLHVRDLPVYDFREALRPPTRFVSVEEEEYEEEG